MFYVGLDLGKRLDFSALAVVEKAEPEPGIPGSRFDHVNWMYRQPKGLLVRHLERIHLGTPYTQVVTRIGKVIEGLRPHGRCDLVVDATGVGMPVVDMLREAKLDCNLVPVLIISGAEQHRTNSVWYVPKVDLLAGLQSALERRILRIARKIPESALLVEELMNVRVKVRSSGAMRVGADAFGQHDDLVLAVALAVWRAKRTGAWGDE